MGLGFREPARTKQLLVGKVAGTDAVLTKRSPQNSIRNYTGPFTIWVSIVVWG